MIEDEVAILSGLLAGEAGFSASSTILSSLD
jgi:hypothetical protein